MSDTISIIIPVHNEEKSIPLLYQEARSVLMSLRPDYDYELIFVNDGSDDKSGEVIEKLIEQDIRVKYIEFSRNFGKEVATSAGLHHAKGAAAIMLDADLQHPPDLIPEFINKWKNGAEIVIGIRKKNQGEGLVKKIGAFFFYKIVNLIGKTKMIPRETDYRLLDRRIINEFNRFTERNRITRGLIDWLGFKRDYVYFDAGERNAGKVRYSFSKLAQLGISTVVSHTLFPLKLAGYLGIVIIVLSGFLGLFILLNQYIFKHPFSNIIFSGTATLATFILFLIGIVLACLGLIALYIANIHSEVINRPIYIIKKKKNLRPLTK